MFSNLRRSSRADQDDYEDNGGYGNGGYNGGGAGNGMSRSGGKANNARHSSALRELGALLRERRETMGVSLAEVEVATRIRQKYLSALESDEWQLLPGEVVGRGFLRNYAVYLGLDPDEVIDRRRAVSDGAVGPMLVNTSAGSNLPPLREVDYRPKEVDLKDEGDGIQRGEIRLTPLFAIVGVALLVVVAWWTLSVLAGPMSSFLAQIPDRLTSSSPTATPTPEPVAVQPPAGVVNPQNLALAENTPESVAEGGVQNLPAPEETLAGTGGPVANSDAGAALLPTSTPEQPQSEQPQSAPQDLAVIASTPEPIAPEPAQPEPTQPEPAQPEAESPPPADNTIILLPTPTPDAAATESAQAAVSAPDSGPAAAPAACADPRSLIREPGVNQTVSGLLGVSGVAIHEEFQYFKLEYAPGLNAGAGFVYFSGSNVEVNGGLLGNLDTRALPNGEYTIRLTVVDQSSNYPPPCDVSFVVQN